MQKFLQLFYGTPPFGMPHVNPTVETWGEGDKGIPYLINAVRDPLPAFSFHVPTSLWLKQYLEPFHPSFPSEVRNGISSQI
jgi:hypothetical protein